MPSLSKNPRADELVAELQSILTEVAAINVNTDGLEALVTAGNVILTSLDGKDYATETTLSSIETLTGDIKTLVTTLTNVDYATETTLAAVEAQTALLTFVGDRLKVDAEITISPEDGSIAAHFSITQSATSVQLMPSNANRREFVIRNAPDSNRNLFVNYRTTATTSTPWKLFRDDVMADEVYTGEVSGIWDGTGAGTAEIIEVTSV